MLKTFGKGGIASLEQGERAVRFAQDAGLEPNGFFLVGLTGDTEGTIEDTIQFARKLPLDSMKCGICVPFPGTPMFQDLHRDGRIKTFDWDQYTVYNRAERIFDHPTLSWDRLRHAFQRFYSQALVRNPAYLLRRFRMMVRNHEIVWHVYYTFKFWKLIWGRQKAVEAERYAYEDRWRPLDTPLEATVDTVRVSIVRRVGTKGRVGSGT